MGWVRIFLAESQSRLYPHMRAKFGRDPTVVSKKVPFNFISRCSVQYCTYIFLSKHTCAHESHACANLTFTMLDVFYCLGGQSWEHNEVIFSHLLEIINTSITTASAMLYFQKQSIN